MGIDLAEIFRPGVDMRIEMDQRRRAALLGERAEQRKGDAVLAAERDQMIHARCLLLNQREAFRNVAQRDCEVTDVGHRQRGRVDPPMGVVAVDQHAARLSNCGGAETRSAPIGDADIQRDSGDANGGARV